MPPSSSRRPLPQPTYYNQGPSSSSSSSYASGGSNGNGVHSRSQHQRTGADLLQPVTNTANGGSSSRERMLQRRISRTDMDFEQALMMEGTMQLREGIDVSQLGLVDMSMDSSMGSPFSSPLSSPQSAVANKSYGSGVSRPLPSTPANSNGRKGVASGGGGTLGTPTIVPPTPSPSGAIASSSSSLSTMGNGATVKTLGASSPSSSSHELFYDADDGASGLTTTTTNSANGSANNLSTSTATPSNNGTSLNAAASNLTASNAHINRRSIYRSPGTSSSPDLATLLRKAREKGDPVTVQKLKKEYPHIGKARQDAPPVPAREYRPRSSTTSGPASTPSSPVNARTVGRGESSMGISGGRSAKEYGSKSKSSVRSFFGKMLGQTSVRERSKTDASLSASASSSPSHPSNSGHASVFGAFPPPVPSLPQEHRVSSNSPIADVFSTSNRPHLDTSKPLPSIVTTMGNATSQSVPSDDDKSMVFIDKNSLPPPTPAKQPDTPISAATIKRSFSIGQSDLKPPILAMSTSRALPKTPHEEESPSKRPGTASTDDSHLHGILDEFRGQLSQLDPIAVQNPMLDLKDPSTPARQQAYRKKSKSDRTSLPSSYQDSTINSSDFGSSAATSSVSVSSSSSKPSSPVLPDVFSSSSTQPSLQSIVIPPRSSSLQSPTPSQTRSASSPMGSSVAASSPVGGSSNQSPRMSSGSGYGMGMPSAFNNGKGMPSRSHSGPVERGMLTPGGGRDAGRLRVLHRSTASSSEPSLIPILDDIRLTSTRRTSHQDLTLNSDLTSPRFAISTTLSPGSGEDSADMETRGKELASRCFNDNDDFLPKEKIAEWLGGHGRINKVALHHYMDFFDFTGLRLDLAFRRLCAKLFLKGETQQVDRILDEFSRRYWECNPGGVYGSANIVHAVSYSLLLLNTDLHVADLSTRMSRSQFVRNTLTAIQTQVNPSSPVLSSSSADLTSYDDCSVRGPSEDYDGGRTVRSKRSDSIASWNSVSRDGMTIPQPTSTAASTTNGSTSSFQNGNETSGQTYGRAWESEMESLLKEMYNAIKTQQILQPISNIGRSSMSSLSPGGGAVLRNRSLRAGGQQDRLTTLKRGSIRGLQSILSSQSGASPYSSNSSIDGRVSPSPSYATSQHEAMYGSSSSFLNPTLGFASNLSHTIIKETQEDDDRSIRSENSTSTTISISDEELALLGAPWAKEGMLCRKQYWESAGKRARDKTWLDVFVVIQKGELSMFVFGDHTSGASGTFGGGNWLANAQSVGSVHLAHSLANPLPPPGYNRQRPHCMVLTLSNGGVYFFQAGTEELVNEWVSTCNYWAARTSKEPLAGGVSNMEYGWSRVVDLHGQRASTSQTDSFRERDLDPSDNVSVKSGKSGHSKFKWRGDGSTTMRGPPSPWNDKIFVNDWKPPMPPSVPSTHDEEGQLEALRKHVASMKKDLETHNELREPVIALYQPRTANAMKAHSNWEKKSQYLLTEIVKYDSYIDSLQAAMSLRLKKRGEKALEHALNGVNPADDRPSKNKYKGPDQDTIDEEVEPTTPGPTEHFPTDARTEIDH